jgi:hypothetical protein
MQHQQHVNVDLNGLSDIGHVGVRRAVLFMGLGLNAAAREDFNDYELYKLPMAPGQTSALMDFFPPNLPANRVAEFKKEFAFWVAGCGLRELLEHYAIFLDQIHRYSLLVYHSKDKLGSLNPVKEQRNFNRQLGIPRKLATLRERFGIEPEYSESVSQLYVMRNCLTHDLGVVSKKFCRGDSELIVTWRGLDTVMMGSKSGLVQVYSGFMGRRTEENATIGLRVVDRERRFPIGQKVRLSQQDLAEICHFFASVAIPTVVRSFVTFLQANGIRVNSEAGVKETAISTG